MASETTRRRFVWAVGVSIAATTVLTAWIALSVGGRAVTIYVDDIATVVAARLIRAATGQPQGEGSHGWS